ncbi:hypothetical protein LINGRAHAP2_LOCUS3973, partial [Linum grandiflorum]
ARRILDAARRKDEVEFTDWDILSDSSTPYHRDRFEWRSGIYSWFQSSISIEVH